MNYAELAKSNGINWQCFYNRVKKLGWDEHKAATTPVMDKREISRLGRAAQKPRKSVVPLEIRQLAKENNINYHTLKSRIKNGWDLVKAATTPPMDMAIVRQRNSKNHPWRKDQEAMFAKYNASKC